VNLDELIQGRLSRRTAMKAGAFLAAGAIFPMGFFGKSFAKRPQGATGIIPFLPIAPSDQDALILPEGFEYTIIRQWGDKISETEYFGYNNDYVDFLPIDLLQGGNNSEDGIMVVNHEYPLPLFVSGYTYEDRMANKKKTPEQITAEKQCVGMSIFRVKKVQGEWQFVMDEKYNRRIDANTRIQLTGKAAGTPEVKSAIYVSGSLANCSGGKTPWGTVLSGEENFQDYPRGSEAGEWGYRWTDQGEEHITEHYGWVLEVDPFDKQAVPKKRTSLGRFRHENVAISQAADGRVVAYMGDDKVNECVYKFVSHGKYNPDDRNANMDLLEDGDLYVADFERNTWQLMDFAKRAELKANFKSQADVLVNCDKSSKMVGGTECNRPEDIQIHPLDQSVYIAFTNNSTKGDPFGSIVRIIESDPTADTFEWEVFATGGVASGFSCPDNLTFDSKGNLWVLCDISRSKLNTGEQIPFKNNAMFMIPTLGEHAGKAFQFASGPVHSEMCGGSFTPDEQTMFVSVQHPGEGSRSVSDPTSRWPNYSDDEPRPAVVAITGFKA
jgi:uncharacterized protein